MKIVIYRFKENNNVKSIQILTNYQIETIEKNDSLNKYNNNEKNKYDYVTMYEIGKDDIPVDILEHLIINYCDKKQSRINDIYDKLQTLEDNINDLSYDISDIKDDIREVLENEN